MAESEPLLFVLLARNLRLAAEEENFIFALIGPSGMEASVLRPLL